MGKVSRGSLKISFPKSEHSFLLENTIQMQYLGNNKLAVQTLFRVFIAHYDLHDMHVSDLKAMCTLENVPS